MAEALFRAATATRPNLKVGSAGVMATNGSRASFETLDVLKRKSVPFEGFRSRSVTEEILKDATHVFAMTESHLAVLEARFPEHFDKYHLLGEFAPESKGAKLSYDVPDPIGMGMDAYEEVAQVFESAVPSIVAYVESGS